MDGKDACVSVSTHVNHDYIMEQGYVLLHLKLYKAIKRLDISLAHRRPHQDNRKSF